MDIPEIQVLTLDKELIPLRLCLSEVVLALEKDGCVILKGATDLTTIEPFIEKPPLEGLLSSVEKNIVINRTIEAILFSAERCDFYITNYRPYHVKFDGQGYKGINRDRQGELIGLLSGLMGVNCIHLGGDGEVLWNIDVDRGTRRGATGKTMEVKANGGDIFICMAWLSYSVPRLELDLPREAIMIVVSYLRVQTSDRRKILPALAQKIVELSGGDCHYKDEYLIWRRKPEWG